MSRRWILALLILAVGITAVLYVHAQSVSPGYSIAATTIVRQVAAVYGEQHPRVLHEEKTFSDPAPGEPMYLIHLSGRFHRGRARSDELYFSALADRHFIWGIQGYQGKGTRRHSTWTDCQRPCTGTLH
jgi:hypothetical protein